VSHWTKVKVAVTDLSVLRKAVEALGLTLEQDAVARGYLSAKFPYVIKLRGEGSYDVGVIPEADGTVSFHCDFYRGSIKEQLGVGLSRLKNYYAAAELAAQAASLGYQFRMVEQGDELVCEVSY